MRSKQPKNFEINLLTKMKKKTNLIFYIILVVFVIGLLFAGYMWYTSKDSAPDPNPNDDITDDNGSMDDYSDPLSDESLDYEIYEEVTRALDSVDDLQLFDFSDSETVIVNITLDSENDIDRITDMMSNIRKVDSVSVDEPKDVSDDRVNVLFRLNILSD